MMRQKLSTSFAGTGTGSPFHKFGGILGNAAVTAGAVFSWAAAALWIMAAVGVPRAAPAGLAALAAAWSARRLSCFG
jgi:hypothetical protein